MISAIRRFLGYRRVSTGEQGTNGTSLDGQKDELASLAAKLGATDVLDFVEVESAGVEKQERRVEVARLLDSVRPGDVVVVTKFDRFTRDLEFAISKVREILNKQARFISIAEGEFESSPEGELKLAIWASIAQMERARIRDRTQGQKSRLRAQGKFMDGRPPFGYVRAKREGNDSHRHLEVCPESARAIVAMFEMCIRGWGTDTISRYLRANHAGRRFGCGWVLRALRNRVYTGQLATTPVRPRGRCHGAQLPANWVDAHEPIISLEMFNRAQAALDGRSGCGGKPRSQSSVLSFLLRGLGSCALCGAVVRCVPGRGTSKHPGYYVCRHRTHPVPSKPRCDTSPFVAYKKIDAMLEQLTLSQLVTMRDLLAISPKATADAPNFDEKRTDILARRKRLVQAVAAGKLTLDDIDAPIAALDAELADIDTAAANHAARDTANSAEGRRAALAFVNVVAEAWAALTPDERRGVIAVLAERIVLTRERTIEVTWRDASELPLSVASVRPELTAKLAASVSNIPANEDTPISTDARAQTRAAKHSPSAARAA